MHEGHRERLRKRFKAEGLDNFSEINMLELLLFFSIPRRDTNPIAHHLLDKYGSLVNVLEADYDDLKTVEGISDNSATLIKMLLPMFRYYMSSKTKTNVIIKDIKQAGEYLCSTYIGETNEIVKMLTIDSKGKVIGVHTLFEGTFNSVDINMRKIIETALISKAACVVIAHNHPNGRAHPSEEDIETTRSMRRALRTISVELLDHIIVADDDYVSLAEYGVFYRM